MSRTVRIPCSNVGLLASYVGVRVMALVEFYLSQARLCDDAARVSADPKIIKSLQHEAARFRAYAANHANQRDPCTSAIQENRMPIKMATPPTAKGGTKRT